MKSITKKNLSILSKDLKSARVNNIRVKFNPLGSYGSVYTCLNPENGKILAIKEMNINPENKQTIGRSFGKHFWSIIVQKLQ